MNDAVLKVVLVAGVWAVAFIVFGISAVLILREPLKARLLRFKLTPKSIELVLQELERHDDLPIGSRAELSGLSSNDIWALNSFALQQIPVIVDQMNASQRVAARTLYDLKLLAITGEGPSRRVAVTSLGQDILRAASSLL